jgi:hypothetical protein
MTTIRICYGRDSDEMVNRLREAQQGKREVSTVEVRETVLDENVIEAIVDLLDEQSVDTVQLDDCGAYLNKQAIRMARALGKVKNVRLLEPTFLTMHFLDSFLVGATALKNLRIQDNLDCRQIEALSSGLKANESLRTLDLSRSRLDSFSILAGGLQENKCLQNLKLRSLGLGDQHVSQILSAMSRHPSLISLDLSFNHCIESNHIAGFLEAQTNLQELYFGYQNVWQAPKFDIGQLAEALTTNSTLTVLSLSRNKLNDDDAILLAVALGNNSTLEYLDLKENKIGDVGACAIASMAAKIGSGLKSLSLVNNPFGELGVSDFLKAVLKKTNLMQIQLPRIDCPLAEQVQLCAALNRGGRKFLYEYPTLALWPLILERVNVLDWEDNRSDLSEEDSPSTYQLDVLYNLLQGPALFEGIMSEKS